MSKTMYLLNAEEAVSEIVGNILILSLTIISVSLILLLSIPSINNLKDNAVVKNAEQSFTILSRSNNVEFGGISRIGIDLGGGELSVIPNGTSNGGGINKESYIIIKNDSGRFQITQPMGKLVYSLGDREVAYEGGGVWSKYPDGSTMISPPELNYNGRTLTGSILDIAGNNNVGGKGTETVSFSKIGDNVQFPSLSNKDMNNPLNYSKIGDLNLIIVSDYYDAWAQYLQGFRFMDVHKDDKNRTAIARLSVVPIDLGSDQQLQNPIDLWGLQIGTLKNLSLKLYNSGNQFINWDIRAKSGDKTLIFYIKDTTLTVGYTDASKSSTGETWGSYTYPIKTDSRGNYIYVDLLANNTYLNYSNQHVGADNANSCQPFGGTINGISNPDYSWNNLIINDSNSNKTQSLYNITEHYINTMAQSGDISLFQCYPSSNGNGNNGNNNPNSDSIMNINYDAQGTVTFLYIKDNNVKVNIG